MNRFLSVMALALGLLPLGAFAAIDPAARDAIMAAFPGVDAAHISESPVDGLYEVRTGSQVLYVTGDAKFLIQGDIFDITTETNVTESSRRLARMEAVDALGESSMIIFAPKTYKHTITVFTDIDCGYCRKLHREMAGYHAQGIRVRYVFFPRSGPDTESWHKAEEVWCAKDRKTALTQAKAGAKIESEDCGSTPVRAEYELGQSFGIRGTPAILTDSGQLIGGYVPPDELVKLLN